MAFFNYDFYYCMEDENRVSYRIFDRNRKGDKEIKGTSTGTVESVIESCQKYCDRENLGTTWNGKNFILNPEQARKLRERGKNATHKQKTR